MSRFRGSKSSPLRNHFPRSWQAGLPISYLEALVSTSWLGQPRNCLSGRPSCSTRPSISSNKNGGGSPKMFDRHRILHRYVLCEYLKIFSLSLSSLILIYIVILFFQKIDLILKHQAPFFLIFKYILYKLPEVTFQWTLPYGILVATLLTLGTFSRHSEIIAMKAAGVR